MTVIFYSLEIKIFFFCIQACLWDVLVNVTVIRVSIMDSAMNSMKDTHVIVDGPVSKDLFVLTVITTLNIENCLTLYREIKFDLFYRYWYYFKR